ncbi:hypothetical protein QTA57_16120 [Fontisubflavum oceani]|uniref:hypothetical protein n=1 Tax=Fontisubflavum oceani TaxID=2978973 RepID=UPI0025B2C274|nr:hypothetical protein [Fontisubflavum oceani]WJY21267.1 hypothetical protein QTA57_16120 [Fontisubflavum oceani]
MDAWLAAYHNPMKPVTARVFPKAKKHTRLILHNGAATPGGFPSQMGDGNEAWRFKTASINDLGAKASDLSAIIQPSRARRDA